MTPTILSGLLDWAARGLGPGRTAIWAEGDGPLPPRPYATLKVDTVVREGSPSYFPLLERAVPEPELVQPILQGALLSVSVDVYGGKGREALALAEAIAATLLRTTARERLQAHGIAFVDVLAAPVDVTKVVGTTHEGRARFDVRFRVNLRDDDPVGWIERVELTGTATTGTFEHTETRIIGVT